MRGSWHQAWQEEGCYQDRERLDSSSQRLSERLLSEDHQSQHCNGAGSKPAHAVPWEVGEAARRDKQGSSKVMRDALWGPKAGRGHREC